MIFNGLQVHISHPLKTYRFESRLAKTKVGPSRIRAQRIKLFDGYVDAVADGEAIVDQMHGRLYVNPKTFSLLKKGECGDSHS